MTHFEEGEIWTTGYVFKIKLSMKFRIPRKWSGLVSDITI